MKKKYVVKLTEEEREQFQQLLRSGSAPARKLNRARILLKADTGPHRRVGLAGATLVTGNLKHYPPDLRRGVEVIGPAGFLEGWVSGGGEDEET